MIGCRFISVSHSHCIGYEEYRNSTIVYGQGNFIFDKSNIEFWQTSLIIKFVIDNNNVYVDYIPITKR